MSSDSGQADLTSPREIRKRDRRKLFVFGLLLGGLAVRINEILNWAWDAEGVGYWAVNVVTDGEIRLAIVGAVGLVAGWLTLFLIDRTKRFQKLFIGFIAIVYIFWNIIIEGHWLGNYNLTEVWYVAIVMFIIGIVCGVLPQLRAGKRQGEYPVAAMGLFLAVAGFSVVGFLDLYWFGDVLASTDANSTLFIPATNQIAVVVDAIAVVIFLGAVGNFTLYNDVRSVVFISSDGEAVTATLVGLFHHVDSDYRGRGPNCLEDGYGDLQSGQTPRSDLCDGRETEFIYLPPGLFPQWVTVSAASVSLKELDNAELDAVSANAGRGWVNKLKSIFYKSVVPGFIERRLQSNTGSSATRVVNADVLVYVTTDRKTINRFEEVCDYIPGYTDKIVVAAQGLNEADLGGLPLGFDIIEIDWSDWSGEDELLVDGIDEVRERLDG